MRYVLVAAGGALGAIARYVVTDIIQGRQHAGFPYGTFAVNVTGCLIIGFAIGLLDEGIITNPNWRLVIVTGFVGAYTTFSTFESETFNLLKASAVAIAAANVVASVVFGFLAVWAGVVAARMVNG